MSIEPITSEFCFRGFAPDDGLITEAQNTLDGLLDLAPYDSTTNAVLECDGPEYRCSVQVFSVEGPFIATATHATPTGAIRFVKDSLLRKFSKWRETRFIPPLSGVMGYRRNQISPAL